MIEIVKHRLMTDVDVPNVLQGVLGVGTAGISAANLAGLIELASTALSVFGLLVGAAAAYYAFISTRERSRQSKIKTEMDQIALDKARAELESVTQHPSE